MKLKFNEGEEQSLQNIIKKTFAGLLSYENLIKWKY